mgnify:CR=1 FL=1
MERASIETFWALTQNIFVFTFGLIVGSFLNVCIFRMPREQSVVKPRSFCPHCKKTVKWYDNIPLLSYALLGGACRFCKKKISFQYFIVELVTGLFFASLYHAFGLSWPFLIYLIFVCALTVATFVDFNFRIIPDEISVGGIVVGLLISFAYPRLHNEGSHFLGLYRSFLGVIIGGGIIWLTGIIGDFVFKKETMGGGDVKLLAMIGAFLGWQMALLTFFIAPFFGSVVGIIIKLKTKSSLIAYGPYLSLASIVVLFWGNNILNWVLYRH